MTGQKGEAEPFAPASATDDVTVPETLVGQATDLGLQHRAAGTTPFGDAHHVYWDEGSARLLSALGVTSPPPQMTTSAVGCVWSAPTVMRWKHSKLGMSSQARDAIGGSGPCRKWCRQPASGIQLFLLSTLPLHGEYAAKFRR